MLGPLEGPVRLVVLGRLLLCLRRCNRRGQHHEGERRGDFHLHFTPELWDNSADPAVSNPRMKRRLAAVVSAVLLLCRCSGSPASPTAPVADAGVPDQSSFSGLDRALLVGAGDTAHCKTPRASLTAQILDRTDGNVFTP